MSKALQSNFASGLVMNLDPSNLDFIRPIQHGHFIDYLLVLHHHVWQFCIQTRLVVGNVTFFKLNLKHWVWVLLNVQNQVSICTPGAICLWALHHATVVFACIKRLKGRGSRCILKESGQLYEPTRCDYCQKFPMDGLEINAGSGWPKKMSGEAIFCVQQMNIHVDLNPFLLACSESFLDLFKIIIETLYIAFHFWI